MTRYIAMPVEVAKTEFSNHVGDVYTTRLGCVHGTQSCGFGTTEEEAFADLLAKLRPHGAKTWKELE